MYGHQTPCRVSAWRPTLVARRHPLPLIILVLAILMAGVLFAAGCGSGSADETTTTAAPAVSTTAPTVSTAAPAVSTTAPTVTEPAEGTFPVTVTDDNKASVTINAKPVRIVSAAPSNTEILFALGLGSRVVGVSSLDDYPPEAKAIAKVGDFQVNTEAVMAQAPDLVLGHSGNEEALAPIAKAGVPVLIFNPSSLEGVYASIDTIGKATGATAQATALVASIKAQVKAVADTTSKTGASPRVFYALDTTLWTAGPGSFVDDLIRLAHGINVAAENAGPATSAYFQLAAEQLAAMNPDVILLPNTAFKSATEFTSDPRFAGLNAVKDGRVMVIDDVVVTRPGPRIAEGLKVLAAAIHPGTF